jgi:Tfp pilus assembly ATPase PilU
MQTMDQALADLVKKGIVRREDATARTSNLRQLNNLLLDAQLSGKVS